MTPLKSILAAASLALVSLPMTVHAADSYSLVAGSGNKTDMARVAAQWKWKSRWGESDGAHIGGYWDLNLAHWRGHRHRGIDGHRQDLTVAGITPVFRLQNDDLQGWYAEAGIGLHLVSGLYDNNDRQLSTKFQFGDHIGIGYVVNKLDIGLQFQHFSNASIRQPNDGVNFLNLRLAYPLD